jgi:recombination DNA repair RAD52 pathway protein
MALTRDQIKRLTRGIDPGHVEKVRGMSYISQHQARAELTRIFGYGNWDSQVESMDLLWEDTYEKDSKTYFRACYKASVRLNIRDYWGNPVCSFVEYHAEANSGLPDRGEAHAMAITSVESYALRRAAIGLGDRLGLGLYEKGDSKPLVVGTLQTTDSESPHHVAPPEPDKGPDDKPMALSRMQDAIKS